MDAVQKQVIVLSHKVDALYQIIEQLSNKVSDSVLEIRQIPRTGTGYSPSAPYVRPSISESQSLLNSVMEHKDVLIDGNNEITSSHHNSDKALSADIQVQRLTAQLTAAYNRIAALEEQLLARRIHS